MLKISVLNISSIVFMFPFHFWSSQKLKWLKLLLILLSPFLISASRVSFWDTMGVEVVGFEAAPSPVEAGTEAEGALLHDKKENGKLNQGPAVTEPIKFGSHGDEPVKGEGNNVSDNFPKDVVEEWPAPKQIHSFYFVRYRPYDDPVIKSKMDQADKEIQKRNQARIQITEELKAKKVNKRFLVLIIW